MNKKEEHPKFHKRVDGICACKIPLTCSVIPNRFWCGKCGKNLESLTSKQAKHIKDVKCKEDMDDDFYRHYGRYTIGSLAF